MDHQSELKNPKYKNWVRGGLAYKYLKHGIEQFADEVVQQEHTRILHDVNASGVACSSCVFPSLRPIHKSIQDPNTGKSNCPWRQTNCNCLFRKKHKCPKQICDAILEDILKSHGSQPPSPNWKNTNVQKWCSMPWEVAKCFINSPGYSDKVSASDIDASGLLHVFINNINIHDHISTKITGTDVFSKTLTRRNKIFHSPKMELEENELNYCIDDIIAVLEDEKELNARCHAQQAVIKLKDLKQKSFIITTRNEVEVCRDAMTSITARSQELKQLIQEAKDDIDTKQMKATTAVNDQTQKALDEALKKLQNFSDSQLQTMKQTVELLNNRIGRVEIHNAEMAQDIAVMKQRLTEIGINVDRLEDVRKNNQIHLDYAEQKQDLQRNLADLYQRDYVKTCICPLKIQDKDQYINEVYVTPSMAVKMNTEFSAGKAESDTRPIQRYRDIFQTNCSKNKKIYIVGDVGTGKSSLGKMMMYDWCKAVTENATQSDNAEEMRKFDFLFYIPLQRMFRFSNEITKMIKTLYKNLVTKTLIHKIFEKDGDCCLIIVDGLDEWIPPDPLALPLHITHGIPDADGIKHATILTFSRPSARGILNMSSTEYDLKISLRGINANSIREFAKKYMAKITFNKDEVSKISLDGFLAKVKLANLQYLEKTPLLLQQLIWTYCKEADIGTSHMDVYGNILNIMFCWSENKEKKEEASNVERSISEDFEQMQLPDIIDKFPRCKINQRLIFLLGKVSFNTLSKEMLSNTFGRLELLSFGFTNSDISALIKLGILVESNCFDPKYEKTYVSFIHISYLELFAAIYISSYNNTISQKKGRNESRTILEELFNNYESADDILRLSYILKMVCGFRPFLIGEISKLVSNIVASDKGLIRYRMNLLEYKSAFPFNSVAEHIQRCMYNCFLKCGSGNDDLPLISLCDVIIFIRPNVSFVRKINPEDVLSLHVNTRRINLDADFVRRIEQFRRLQYTHLYIEAVSTSCEVYTQLYASLGKLVSLKQLTLKYSDILNPTVTKPPIINLSKLCQLQGIHLDNAYFVLGIEAKNLEKVFVSLHHKVMKHVQIKQLSSALIQAVSLKSLELNGTECNYTHCEGHTIDLSKNVKLESILVRSVWCKLGSVTNLKTLVLNMSLRHSKVNHEVYEHLTSSVSQAVRLQVLHLEGLHCDSTECHGHDLDLSRHDRLASIHLKDCSHIYSTAINTKNLQSVRFASLENVSYQMCERLLPELEQAVSSHCLMFYDITCDKDSCERCAITKRLKLLLKAPVSFAKRHRLKTKRKL